MQYDYSFDDPMEYAADHVRRVLDTLNGGLPDHSTIASNLLNFDLKNGQVTAYAWSRYLDDAEKARNISSHRPLPFASNSAWRNAESEEEVLVPFLHAHLQHDTHYVVLHDLYARIGHAYLERTPETFFVHGSYIYPFLAPYASIEAVRFTMRVPCSPILGVVTSLPSAEPAIQDRQTLQDSTVLELFAARTTHIFAEAFDGCGFLLWQRP